jgi:hypothetical protein
METRCVVEVMRYFHESPTKKNKKGLPVLMPVDVRKIRLYGEFIVTDAYICTLVKRHGDRTVSVKERKKPLRAWWDKTPIKAEEYTWKKEGSYTLEKFEEWLGKRIGQRAPAVVSEMLTAPPENLAA